MRRVPLIALLTDFGAGSHYAGIMKGVILARRPGAAIVDITHGVSPGNVGEGAYLLWSAFPWFPPRTIFAAVVDPGVGTRRRILAVRFAHGKTVIAPDNGLLKYLLGDFHPAGAVYALDAARLSPGRTPSRTFHGRDLFAPAAAIAAGGAPLSRLGPRAVPRFGGEEFLRLDDRPGRGAVTAAVVHIDRFGNIVTNVRTPRDPAAWTVRIGGRKFRRAAAAYALAPHDAPFLIGGSSGLLEISVRGGSAAAALGATLRHRPVFTR